MSLLSFTVGFLAIALGLIDEACADKPPKRPYQYVSLDAAIPEGFFFDPRAITDSGRIYGTLFSEAGSPFVAVYSRGEITALHEGFANDANNRGTIGGSVVRDPDQGTSQAALFTRREVELIPPLADEFSSEVRLLTNSGIASVELVDSNFEQSYYLTRNGHVTPLDFRPIDINDRGIISGTFFRSDGNRAFRYDPFSDRLTELDPLPTEPASEAQAINNRGDVLGYSFDFGVVERIGVWRGTKFHTYFVEGTPEVPTVSFSLLWNERGLIVITDTDRADLNSYLVPRPGVRLNLADLTDRPLPPWTLILDINNRGDLIGWGGERFFEISSVFLLRRVGPIDGKGGDADSLVASSLESEADADGDAALSSEPVAAAAGAGARHAPALERILHERLNRLLGEHRAAKRKDLPDE
jgi:hypothetical protein